MASGRSERVKRQLLREVTAVLKEDLRDPRVGFVTVTNAEVTPDLRNAKVFVSILGTPAEQEETFTVLANAAGFVRTQVGHRMLLRRVPEIRFVKDESIEHVTRLFKIMDEIKSKEGASNDC